MDLRQASPLTSARSQPLLDEHPSQSIQLAPRSVSAASRVSILIKGEVESDVVVTNAHAEVHPVLESFDPSAWLDVDHEAKDPHNTSELSKSQPNLRTMPPLILTPLPDTRPHSAKQLLRSNKVAPDTERVKSPENDRDEVYANRLTSPDFWAKDASPRLSPAENNDRQPGNSPSAKWKHTRVHPSPSRSNLGQFETPRSVTPIFTGESATACTGLQHGLSVEETTGEVVLSGRTTHSDSIQLPYIPFHWAQQALAEVVNDMKAMKSNHIEIVNKILEAYSDIELESKVQYVGFVRKLKEQHSSKVGAYKEVVKALQDELTNVNQHWEGTVKSISQWNKDLLEENKLLYQRVKDGLEQSQTDKEETTTYFTKALDKEKAKHRQDMDNARETIASFHEKYKERLIAVEQNSGDRLAKEKEAHKQALQALERDLEKSKRKLTELTKKSKLRSSARKQATAEELPSNSHQQYTKVSPVYSRDAGPEAESQAQTPTVQQDSHHESAKDAPPPYSEFDSGVQESASHPIATQGAEVMSSAMIGQEPEVESVPEEVKSVAEDPLSSISDDSDSEGSESGDEDPTTVGDALEDDKIVGDADVANEEEVQRDDEAGAHNYDREVTDVNSESSSTLHSDNEEDTDEEPQVGTVEGEGDQPVEEEEESSNMDHKHDVVSLSEENGQVEESDTTEKSATVTTASKTKPGSTAAQKVDPKLQQEYKKLKAQVVELNKQHQADVAKLKALEREAARGGKNTEGSVEDKREQKKKEKELKDAQKQLEAAKNNLGKVQTQLKTNETELSSLKKDHEKLLNDVKNKEAELKKLAAAAKDGAAAIEKADKLQAEVKVQTEEIKKIAASFNSERLLRKKYYNIIEDMKGKIRVYCRVRPLSSSEKERNDQSVVESPDEYSIHIRTTRAVKEFQFDQVFTSDHSQERVFEDTQNLIQSAVDGYNVCIFAYGQTGSGKTYTMIGGKDSKGVITSPGIAPRAFEEVYQLLDTNRDKYSFNVACYMLELYNDKLIDLFPAKGKEPAKLEIKKDKKGMVVVQGAISHPASSAEALMELFEVGSKNRHVSSTKMNAESSRSHLVIGVIIESTNLTNGSVHRGKLSIVDLAGSERASKTGATPEQLKEAQSINKSLSALGDVISALSSGQDFVPYRNNRLTLLMQDSLGGNAKTLMFVNVSPADYNTEETVTSLTYAARVKLITNDASKNAENKEIARLKGIIGKLKRGEELADEEDD